MIIEKKYPGEFALFYPRIRMFCYFITKFYNTLQMNSSINA